MNTRKNNNTEKIILGIDPGTNVMGYGVIKVMGNKAQLVVMGVIDMRKESDPYLRLGKIFERVTGIIVEYLPDEMAIEAPATDALGAAYCHFLQMGRPETNAKHYSSWKDFATRNQGRVEGSAKLTGPRAQLMAALNRTTHK